jgi:hypothetical protein
MKFLPVFIILTLPLAAASPVLACFPLVVAWLPQLLLFLPIGVFGMLLDTCGFLLLDLFWWLLVTLSGLLLAILWLMLGMLRLMLVMLWSLLGLSVLLLGIACSMMGVSILLLSTFWLLLGKSSSSLLAIFIQLPCPRGFKHNIE